MLNLFLPLLALWMFLPTPLGSTRVPFAGGFAATFVSDSNWSHCELRVSVESDGHGSERLDCRYPDDRPPLHLKAALKSHEIERLRRLLREADLFQGQFWGIDHRSLDMPFVTLAVDDETRAAVVVCVLNQSFDSGSREALLMWLTYRFSGKSGEAVQSGAVEQGVAADKAQ